MRDYDAEVLRALDANDIEALRRMAFGPPLGCGCLGARDGDPECPCGMRAMTVRRYVLPAGLVRGKIVRVAGS